MSVQINYKKPISKKETNNFVLFVDDKFNINHLKKHIILGEYTHILDLLKTADKKKDILFFDISSTKKIFLVSIKPNLKNLEIENLGAKFYDLISGNKKEFFILQTDTLKNNFNDIIGFFLHGVKLKSYNFDKYKSKKK